MKFGKNKPVVETSEVFAQTSEVLLDSGSSIIT